MTFSGGLVGLHGAKTMWAQRMDQVTKVNGHSRLVGAWSWKISTRCVTIIQRCVISIAH